MFRVVKQMLNLNSSNLSATCPTSLLNLYLIMKKFYPLATLRNLKSRFLGFYNFIRKTLAASKKCDQLAQQFEEFKGSCIQDWLLKDLGDYKLQNHQALVSLRDEMIAIVLASRHSIDSHAKKSLLNRVDRATLDPYRSMSLDEAKGKLRQIAPLNYEMFETALEVGTKSYTELPTVSCSTENHPQSILFKYFVSSYLIGLTLDIGCGPQPLPSYLAGHPPELIYGIDPISTADSHPFSFYSGFGEFLPWASESFDTVVSGTTLDHYYLLDKGLDEVNRVLKPGGFFIAWITEFPDALEAYNPYTKMDKPYDEEHLFHVNRSWFIPYIKERGFEEVECITFELPFSYLFMAFRKI